MQMKTTFKILPMALIPPIAVAMWLLDIQYLGGTLHVLIVIGLVIVVAILFSRQPGAGLEEPS